MKKPLSFPTHLFLFWVMLLVSTPGFSQYKKAKKEPEPAVQPTSLIVEQRLNQELERIAKLAKGKVGLCAVHLESGQQVSMNLQERFPMASTVKVAIAVNC